MVIPLPLKYYPVRCENAKGRAVVQSLLEAQYIMHKAIAPAERKLICRWHNSHAESPLLFLLQGFLEPSGSRLIFRLCEFWRHCGGECSFQLRQWILQGIVRCERCHHVGNDNTSRTEHWVRCVQCFYTCFTRVRVVGTSNNIIHLQCTFVWMYLEVITLYERGI